MAKGFFSQGVCLLSNGKTTIDDVRAALPKKEWKIVNQTKPGKEWQFGGATLVLAFLPEVNGYAAIDVVNRPWPDSMGDPQSDSTTFAAWTMGHFGPQTFPGGLARAGQHSWAWQPGQTIAEGHRGFIRIRISYCFDASDDTPVLPDPYDPIAEMHFLSRAVLAVFEAPGVVCYFNPNGEVLRDAASFREVWVECEQQQKLPLPLWMNIRFFNLNERLGFMDTVGNGQLDLQDVEAIFPQAQYDPGDIDHYLRNVTHYLLNLDKEIKSGDEIDGPGESNLSWTADVLDEGTSEPPRRVVRLYPKASRKEVRAALKAIARSSS